jgi:endoglucanase
MLGSRRRLAAAAALGALLAGCEPPASAQAEPVSAAGLGFPMQRCVNLGNALEAQVEGSWGYAVRKEDLVLIAAAGFDGVRVPVRWDPHMGPGPAYAIDPVWIGRVQEVVDQALAAGLMVQLNVHHFEGLVENPGSAEEAARFVAIWRQIAERFQGYDGRLMFELLNEPFGGQWTNERLEQLHRAALAAIRPTHPERLVILGAIRWNSLEGLEGFDGHRGYRPPGDPHVALTFHSYFPYEFTHQGADWLGADAPRWDRAWGTAADRGELWADAGRAAALSRAASLPIQLGEFGVITEAPLAERLAWLRTMREAMEAQGVAWCVWDFGVAFAVYDREREDWIPGAREALGLRP